MPRIWTPEQRAAFGATMAAKRSAKKVEQSGVETDAQLNPIATDVIAPTPKKRAAFPKLVSTPKVPAHQTPDFSTLDLIKSIESIPLETITYEDCGKLLNALSAASTVVAQTRRQRQEQLEFGTHKAVCKTCGRVIDISKSGGFQILTERDEFHMPVNKYYCSQNCLLARNMPSHARQTPRQKQVNQA